MQRWVKILRDDLCKAGFTVFLDLSPVEDGALNDATTQAIEGSDAVLVIGAPHYFECVQDEQTRTALELKTLLTKAETGQLQILPLLWAGERTSAFPAPLHDHLIRNYCEDENYVNNMMNLSDPPGLLPALLGVTLGDEPYEALLARYHLNTLTHLPPANPDFQGRESNLVTLASVLQEFDQQTITGLGGVGKSQLALAYAYRHQAKYQFCHWLLSETKEQLVLSLRSLAVQVGIDPEGQSETTWIKALYERLSTIKSWLLIFDHAEEEPSLEDYLPPKQNAEQHIIITSRSEHWQHKMRLDVMTEKEGLAYLTARLPAHDLSAAASLIKTLDGLPLAIAQAAAYLDATKLGVSDYLTRLEPTLLKFLEKQDEETKCPATVASTWLISLEYLKIQNPIALPLIMMLAYVAADDIPLGLCASFMGNNEQLDEALVVLCRYSLISPGNQADQINIHRLVQVVIKEALTQGYFEEAQKTHIPYRYCPTGILTRLQISVASYYPYEKRTKADFTLTRNLLAHLKTLIEHYEPGSTSRDTSITRTLSTQPDVSEASIVEANEAYELEQAYLLEVLADAHSALGDAAKQKELLERALVIFESHLVLDHLDVARMRMNLGNAYGDLGNAAKQKELLEQALIILERHPVRDHLDVARALESLGNACGALGERIESKKLLQQALVIFEHHLGTDHKEIARVLLNLGNAHGALGEWDNKKELLERALIIFEYHFGLNHPDAVKLLENLGNTYSALGNMVKSKELLGRALGIIEHHLGLDRPDVANTLVGLGKAYGDLGNAAKSKELLERALVILEPHLGLDHLNVAITLMGLGNAYGDLCDAAKQKALLERALVILVHHFGPNHPEIASTLINLGNACGDLGEGIKSKEFLERALAILEPHLGPNDPEVAITLMNLANTYGDLGDPAKKKELLERALVIFRHSFGSDDHPDVANTLMNLGNAYGDLDNPTKKKELLEQALVIFEHHFDPDHLNIAKALMNLGNAHFASEEAIKSIEPLKRALVIFEHHLGPNHSNVATTLESLGNAYGVLGNAIESKELLERALVILERYFGQNHVQVATTVFNLGRANERLSLLEEAQSCYERAYRIKRAYYGAEHLSLRDVAAALADLSKLMASAMDKGANYFPSNRSSLFQTPKSKNTGIEQAKDQEETKKEDLIKAKI